MIPLDLNALVLLEDVTLTDVKIYSNLQKQHRLNKHSEVNDSE